MGSGQRPTKELTYTLGDAAARTRARVGAVVGTFTALAPAVLVVIVLKKLGYVLVPWTIAVLVAIAVLATVRGLAEYRAMCRRLRAFRVTLDAEELRIVALRGELRIDRSAIDRVVDISGPLGGLRVLLQDVDDLPARIDIPRGGADFGELRAALAGWAPMAPARRRGRVTRFWTGVGIALGIFFLPFIFDDFVAHSKVVALTLIFAMWAVMRLIARH